MLLDHFRSESVWSPYCKFSIPEPKSALATSYRINLSSSGRDSRCDEDESIVGSPNVVMLTEKSWQFATDEMPDSTLRLSGTYFEPHLHEHSCSGEEQLGYSRLTGESRQDSRAMDEGYRSPVEYGLPVADMMMGGAIGEGCDGCGCGGGAKECVGDAMDCKDRHPQGGRGYRTLDSGLEEADNIVFRFCEESNIYA